MWKNLIIICACAFCKNINVVRGQAKPFIFGGQQVFDNTYKFMVYVNYDIEENITITCSASLIHEKWVLTSAHCFEVCPRIEKVRLVAGQPKIPMDFENHGNNLQIKNASKIYINEGYDFDDEAAFDNDIALVEVETPFKLNENVSCIKYFKGKSVSKAIIKEKDCTIVGFGMTEMGTDGTLYHNLHNTVLPPTKCQQIHPKYRLNGHFVCILNNISGLCNGDSGGPLLCDGKIYGLSTMAQSMWKNCTDVKESYFLSVEPYTDWIADKIEAGYAYSSIFLIVLLISVFLLLLGLLYYVYSKKKDILRRNSEYDLIS